MKKLRYTLIEAYKHFPLLMNKTKTQESLRNLKNTLNGIGFKKKVFKKQVKNRDNKIIPHPVLFYPFDFRRSFNYKGRSNYIWNNGINYKVANARKSGIFVFVCFSEHCNRKFLSIAKGRDLRRKCKPCRINSNNEA